MKKVRTLLVLLCLTVGLCFALASCGETEHTEHTWDDGKVTKSATCTIAGTKLYTCTECGETKTEEVKALGHDFSETYEKDGEDHWQVCARCKAEVNHGTHKYAEDPEAGVAPTCNTAGKKVLKCEVCGDTQETPLRATGEHVKGTELKFDENQHWYECTDCGMRFEQKSHDIVTGAVTGIDPSSCRPGERTDACKECDYEVKMSVDSGVMHDYAATLHTAEKKLTLTCAACHNVREMDYRFGDDFSDYEVDGKLNSAYDGTVTYSDLSVVREDENGNKYGYFQRTADPFSPGQFFHNNSFIKESNFLGEYEAFSARVMLSFTDEDGQVKGTKSLQIDIQYDTEWAQGGGYANSTVNADGTLSLAGVKTDIMVETDKWLTFTYIANKSTAKCLVMVTDEEGNTFSTVIDKQPSRGNDLRYILKWKIQVADANGYMLVDDIMYWTTRDVVAQR